MSKKKRLEREFMWQDKRFDHAKAQAEKHIRRSEAWVIIMDDVLAEMHRINRGIKEERTEVVQTAQGGRGVLYETKSETAIYFTEDQFDVILKWMEDTGSETVQDAIMDAIARAKVQGKLSVWDEEAGK